MYCDTLMRATTVEALYSVLFCVCSIVLQCDMRMSIVDCMLIAGISPLI